MRPAEPYPRWPAPSGRPRSHTSPHGRRVARPAARRARCCSHPCSHRCRRRWSLSPYPLALARRRRLRYSRRCRRAVVTSFAMLQAVEHVTAHGQRSRPSTCAGRDSKESSSRSSKRPISATSGENTRTGWAERASMRPGWCPWYPSRRTIAPVRGPARQWAHSGTEHQLGRPRPV